MSDERRPPGITALSVFFAFVALMSAVMAVLVLFPGTVSDAGANTSASPLMITVSLMLMIAACVASIAASVGLWKCMRWGLWTAVILLCANLLSEISDVITTGHWQPLIGFPLAGLMIWYLLRKKELFAA